MPSLAGVWDTAGPSSSSSSMDCVGSMSLFESFSRAKRMGEASRACCAACSSRKMARATLSAGL